MEGEDDPQGNDSSSTLSTVPSLIEAGISSAETQNSQTSLEKEQEDESQRNTTSSGRPARKAASRQVAKPAATISTKRTPKKSKWDAENIVSDSKSPLAKADLRRLLANPMAWDILDASEKAEILALFPDKDHILDPETENARPNLMSLMNDDTFRYDCATYTENIAMGRFDPEWLSCAWSAHERRKLGDFDDHLVDKFETDWQVHLPQEFKPKRQVARNSNTNESANGDAKTNENITEEAGNGDNASGDSNNKEPESEPQGQAATNDAADSDAMSIDELQAESTRPIQSATPSKWRQRRNSTIQVAGIADEDELA